MGVLIFELARIRKAKVVGVDSTCQRNTLFKICFGVLNFNVFLGLIQFFLRRLSPTGFYEEVLLNKAISVLVGTSLPWALWCIEIYWHACIGRKICMFCQLYTRVPSQ
ncbi:Uncharacterised protein [Yersinia intermedia]|nr:Uncharacterised protein [Yersinia intermedia]